MTKKQIKAILIQGWVKQKSLLAYVNTGEREERLLLPGAEYKKHWWTHNLQNIKVWYRDVDKMGNVRTRCDIYKIKNITTVRPLWQL